MNVIIALAMIAIGMVLDAVYQHRIRSAECDAYETGYQQGLKENRIVQEISFTKLQDYPSMAAPVNMPPTFEERLRKHGRAVVKLK